MTTISLLRAAGEALYGPRWQSDLARELHISDRTMRRWLAGPADLPTGVAADIRQLCETRASHLKEVIDRLKVAATPN